MRRHLSIALLATLVLASLAAGLLALRAPADRRASASAGETAALLRSGAARYRMYVDAELASWRERSSAGDDGGARIPRGRGAPAMRAGGGRPSTDPVGVTHAAALVLSLDARGAGRISLLDVESHTAGAGVAFDAIRDALWARDKGLVGSIDERLANLRTELDGHRRGDAFTSSGALDTAERRRLAAALDALAWRLELAAARLAAKPA